MEILNVKGEKIMNSLANTILSEYPLQQIYDDLCILNKDGIWTNGVPEWIVRLGEYFNRAAESEVILLTAYRYLANNFASMIILQPNKPCHIAFVDKNQVDYTWYVGPATYLEPSKNNEQFSEEDLHTVILPDGEKADFPKSCIFPTKLTGESL